MTANERFTLERVVRYWKLGISKNEFKNARQLLDAVTAAMESGLYGQDTKRFFKNAGFRTAVKDRLLKHHGYRRPAPALPRYPGPDGTLYTVPED